MEKNEVRKEKRIHKRFRAKDNHFAVIKRKINLICKVVNISLGGVLFFSEDLDSIGENDLKVDLYIDTDVFIHDIIAGMVSDFTTQDEDFFDGFPIRHLRLFFAELTEIQKERLIKILQSSDPESAEAPPS
jgi:hypothetical protein